jgi:hypothetical protein
MIELPAAIQLSDDYEELVVTILMRCRGLLVPLI